MDIKRLLAVAAMAVCGWGAGARAQNAEGGFVLGGDMSWITKMESEGKRFRDAGNNVCDGMELFARLGMQAVRFRVWVNPAGGWDGAADVLAKCQRAKELNLGIMIDFHYSDTWADPGHQTKPKAWEACSAGELADSVARHTREVLTLLKDNEIDVRWVQVGNEITNGMLWPDGKLSDGAARAKNCARFVSAGYDAVKEVYPDTPVILHIDQGDNYEQSAWSLGLQKQNAAKWDITGVSFYPGNNWAEGEQALVANIRKYASLYKRPVMICETGINWNSPQAEAFLTTLRNDAKALGTDTCLGIFYWEPDGYPGYNGGYQKGAVNNMGKPTAAITAFYKPDESAAIHTPAADSSRDAVFTLDGRRMDERAPLACGMYIVGNRKMWVR